MSKPVQTRQHASSKLPDLCGSILNGTDIRLLKCIGKGSWGVVYLAERLEHPGIRFAVKVTDKKLFKSDHDHSREGRLHELASMASPNVVRFYKAFDDDSTGYHYLITEYCPGGDLRVRIEADSNNQKSNALIRTQQIRGSDELMKRLLIQALDAIADCHAQGVFHRDLKPDNLFLRDDENIFLGDFGFATTRSETTSFGTGSEPYMSPECLNEFRKLDHFSCAQSDIWSFGMIMLTLVCGKFPWRKPSLDEFYYRTYVSADRDVLLKMFEITPEFNTILKGAFAINPRKRSSLQVLREQLSALQSFGSGAEKEKKRAPEIRVPVFIDLPSEVLNEPLSRAHIQTPQTCATAVDRPHPMFTPPLHHHHTRVLQGSPFHSPRPEPELLFEKEVRNCERKNRIHAIGKLLETALPVENTQARPPIAPRPTRELVSSNDSDEGPATPEVRAADAARAVAVADNASSPTTTTFAPLILPEPLTKRSRSEGMRTVDNAKRRLRGMLGAFRPH